jgi:hypothetical protein
MALLLWALASGYVLGLVLTGPAVGRAGVGRLLLCSAVLACVALAWVGLDTQWPSRIAWLVVLGAGGGMWEATMNLQAGRCADGSRGRLMPRLHAAFSAGAAGGVLGGIVAARRSVEPGAHFLGVAGVLGVLILGAVGASGIWRETGTRNAAGSWTRSAWRDRRTVALGLLLLGIATAEGAVADWLPLVLVHGFGRPEDRAAGGLLLFAAAMIMARWAGSGLPARVGADRLLAAGLLVLTVGIGVLAVGGTASSGDARVAVGVALWAAGVAMGFPLVMSAAAERA